jgi:RNA polymerase sigma-70 factor (ECF subfamily)
MVVWAEAADWVLLRAARRQPAAMGELFRRHRDYVFRLAWGFTGDRNLAEDAVQEVFIRLMSPRLAWRPRAAFTTWLYRVVQNVSRELRRAGIRELIDAGRPVTDRPGGDPAEDERRLAELAGLLARLPERQREVVVLRVLEGLSTKETAQAMGCREGTVKAHLHKASLALRAILSRDDSGDGKQREEE